MQANAPGRLAVAARTVRVMPSVAAGAAGDGAVGVRLLWDSGSGAMDGMAGRTVNQCAAACQSLPRQR